jgi:chorismate mutase
VTEEQAAEELAALREEIERIDRALVAQIAERVRLAGRIGVAKLVLGLPTLDPRREAFVVRRAGELARDAGISDEDTRYLFWHLIAMSRRAQMEQG